MIVHYLKVAFRNLVKYKMQSLISIIGLTVGFTVFILGGYWYYWETHFDNFHPEENRLYAITTSGIFKKASGMDAELAQVHHDDVAYFIRSVPEIEKVCLLQDSWYRIERDKNLQQATSLIADSAFFELFHTEFIEGTYKGVIPNRGSVVLTESTARKFFGSTRNVIGQAFFIEENYKPTVVGIIKDYPGNSELSFDFIEIGKVEFKRQANRYTTYVRLKNNVDADVVRKKINAHKSVAKLNYGQSTENWVFNLRIPAEVHLNCHPELDNRIRNIYILAFAGLLAFVSALMNLLVLFIGQQQRKKRNNITYLSLGGSVVSLTYKSLVELLLLMSVSFFLAFCCIEILFPYYQNYTAWNGYGVYENVTKQINRTFLFKNTIYLMAISTVLFIAVSIYPIIRIVKSTASPILLRRALITGQVFIGSLFFITSLSLFKQLYFIQHTDKGIDYERIIQIDLGFETSHQTDIRVLKNKITQNPMVEQVSFTVSPVFSEQGDWYCSYINSFAFTKEDLENPKEYNVLLVDREYFSLFGLKLKTGSMIAEANPLDFLINETGFRQMGLSDLLTRTMLCPPEINNCPPVKVCGIVNDFHHSPMQYPIQKLFFQLLSDETDFMPAQYIYVKYKAGHKAEVLAHLRNVIKEIDKNEVTDDKKLIELSTIVKKFNKPEENIFIMFSILAFICILISTFGIFSLVSLSAEQRKKEIAIRKVNGATFRNILHLFFKEYLMLVVTGNAIALLVGYLLMQRWLETYSYRTTLSWWLFVCVFIITCLIVIFSIFGQVNKAAKTNPAEAVKAE